MTNRRDFLGRLAALAGAMGLGACAPEAAASRAAAFAGRNSRMSYNGVEIDFVRTTGLATVIGLNPSGRTLVRYSLRVSGIVRLRPGRTADEVRGTLATPGRDVEYRFRGSGAVRGRPEAAPNVKVRPIDGAGLVTAEWEGEFVGAA